MNQGIEITIVGMGIIFYSPFAVARIPVGKNYLATSFTDPKAVAAHVTRGDISAFCTGSGGDFELIVYDGELDSLGLRAAQFKARLALEVRGGAVCFRDLYDLMDWTADCPPHQCVRMKDGFYRITAYSSTPPSGIRGDHQKIWIHFEPAPTLPELSWKSVPQLC